MALSKASLTIVHIISVLGFKMCDNKMEMVMQCFAQPCGRRAKNKRGITLSFPES